MSSTVRYASHSELTRKTPKENFCKKLARTLDLKIQKQISPTCLLLPGNMNTSAASYKAKDEKKIT